MDEKAPITIEAVDIGQILKTLPRNDDDVLVAQLLADFEAKKRAIRLQEAIVLL